MARGDPSALLEHLRQPETIRARCEALFRLGEADQLPHFRLHLDRLGPVADRVVTVTRAAHPTLAIPYHARWRHFGAGSPRAARARLERLDKALDALDPQERARARFDLAVTSVLLDAGAGPGWRWIEPGSREFFTRSEGLALASLEMFLEGGFSSDPERHPLRADAAGLAAVDEAALARAFQVRELDNNLVGLAGRAELLQRLGKALARDRARFGDPPRVGHLFDHLTGLADGGRLPARQVLRALLEGMAPIWTGGFTYRGTLLGDVWPHPSLTGPEPGDELVPFHKLTQWLCYSLLEPLEAAGVAVVELDALTGLPEYRNGGLFLDLGLLELRDPRAAGQTHPVGSALVVEWRALTVALLDRVAVEVRQRLGLSQDEFPLAKVLEGGTWQAGRLAARDRRPDGVPPLTVESDGTVF